MKTTTSGIGAILALELCLLTGVQADVIANAAHIDWTGEQLARTLDDGSVMTEYMANSVAAGRADAVLSVAFMPRFECTPLIGVRIDREVSDDPERTEALLRSLRPLDDGDRLNMVIDEKRVPFPVHVDRDGERTALWYAVDREDRETLTLQMDGGDKAQIALSTSTTLDFSLLGSRKSMRAVRQKCLMHEPVPFGDN